MFGFYFDDANFGPDNVFNIDNGFNHLGLITSVVHIENNGPPFNHIKLSGLSCKITFELKIIPEIQVQTREVKV